MGRPSLGKPKKKERVLTVEALADAGIDIAEEALSREATLATLGKESPQARDLARDLLDFEHIITYEHWEEIAAETPYQGKLTDTLVIPEARPPTDSWKHKRFMDKYDIRRCVENFDIALNIKERADKIDSKDEERWGTVIKEHLFKRLRDQAENKRAHGGNGRRRDADALKPFEWGSQKVWQYGRQVLQQHCQDISGYDWELKAPKADGYFSFYAYDEKDLSGCLYADDNFGLTALRSLHKKYPALAYHDSRRQFGIAPSPCRGFYDPKSSDVRTCFPWAVCEWKHHGVKARYEQYMHCQAANGAALCLTLLANAATGGRPAPVLREIRPLVCMTFKGPMTKIWVAYVTKIEAGRYSYRMRCIWDGSLQSILDNIKLCVIIENLHFWAMNDLRPWLSRCIDQWRRTIENMDNLEGFSAVPKSTCRELNSSPGFALRRSNTLDSFQDEESEYDSSDDSPTYIASDQDDDEGREQEYEISLSKRLKDSKISAPSTPKASVRQNSPYDTPRTTRSGRVYSPGS